MKAQLEIQNIKKNQIAILGFQTNLEQNTFDLESLEQLIKVLEDISNHNDALILYSLEKSFFSNGLNLEFFQKSNKSEKRELLQLMVKCFRLLLSLKKFWISEIYGHCVGGGLVIALASDYRFMVENSGRIAFSEVSGANFFLPQSYIEGLNHMIPHSYIKEMIEGRFFKSHKAKEIQLIDETFESKEQVRKASINKIKKVLTLNQKAFLTSRNCYREILVEKIKKIEILDYNSIEQFI